MNKKGKLIVCVVMAAVFMLPVPAVKNEIKNAPGDRETGMACTFQSTGAGWSETYGGEEFDMLHCVQETDDGDYIACGVTTAADMEGVIRPWIVKVDADGDEVWDWELTEMEYEGNYFNHFDDCYCSFVQETSDGGCAACVGVLCNDGSETYWVCGLAKLDASGTEEWIQSYAVWREWSFHPRSLIERGDGGFIVVGLSGNYNIDDDLYACLMKTDAAGDEVWRQEYNHGDGDDQAWAVCTTNDGGYLLTGWAETETGGFDYWMIKTDDTGDKEWDKAFGGATADYGHSRNCYQTNDDGYIMSGYSYSFGAGRADAWIVKTDSLGNMAWNKTYGGENTDVCWSGGLMDENGYVFCVTNNINGYTGDKADVHLVKTDSDGNTEWIQEFGGPGIQIGMYVSGTSDGGLIVSGRTGSLGNPSSDGLLVKYDPFENKRPNKPAQPSGPARGRPGTDYTFTTSATDPDGGQLWYKWDWGDGNYSDWLDTNQATHAWTGENNYNVRVMARDDDSGESDWSDPLPFSTPIERQTLLEKIMEWILYLIGINIS